VSRVTGRELTVQGSGFRVQGSGFRVQGSGFRVHGSGFMVEGFRRVGCRAVYRSTHFYFCPQISSNLADVPISSDFDCSA
jgi:hypothetical protein